MVRSTFSSSVIAWIIYVHTGVSAAFTLQCPTGWSLYGGSCYVYIATPLPWYLARDNCKSNGGYLVQPEGYDQIQYLTTKTTGSSFWIGFNALGVTGDILKNGAWSDGSWVGPEVGTWGYNQPDISRGRCVRLKQNGAETKWYYDNCDLALTYFCELKPCTTDNHRCWSSGQCIARSEVNNGRVDCGDGSDETDNPSTCHYVTRNPSQAIQSPNFPLPYSSLLNCYWTIIGTVGSRVHINFTSFNVERDFDEVYVWSGGITVSESSFVGRLSGGLDNIAATYWSSNNLMILQFVSDNDTQLTGFSASWAHATQHAGGSINLRATDDWQTLNSPFYSANHVPGGVWATWTITAQSDRVISLQVLAVSALLPQSVTVFDGPHSNSPVLTYITTDIVSSFIYSTKKSILIQLSTNQGLRDGRFRLLFKQGCGASITGDNGVIQSPGYPTLPYPAMTACEWIVTNTKQRTYTLNLLYKTEPSKDFVQVYDGPGQQLALHPGQGFSGSAVDRVLFTTSSTLTINFITSASNILSEYTGFQATYSIGCFKLSINTVTTTTNPAIFGCNYGDVVSVVCRAGYKFADGHSGAKRLECLSGGEWSHRFQACKAISCGRIPIVVNGYIQSTSGTTPGSLVMYVCFDGFTMTGSDVIRCSHAGTWEQPPFCTARICSPRPSLTSGTFSYTNKPSSLFNQYQTIAAFSCNENYELSGFSRVVCLKNGTWSHVFPTCQKRFCWVANEPHGRYTPSPGYRGDIVTVSCDLGYSAAGGLASFRCGYESPATCVDVNECKTNNGGCSQNCGNTPGSYLCSCRHGYASRQGNSDICEDVDECKQTKGQCSHGCLNHPGTYRCTCPFGQELFDHVKHADRLGRGETGLQPWNVYYANHTCVLVRCEVPQLSSALVVLSDRRQYHYGDVIKYMCTLGHTMQGSAALKCRADMTWNETTPTCKPANCPPASLSGLKYPPVLVSDSGPVAYDSLAKYECHLGNTVISKSQRCAYDAGQDVYRLLGESLECPVRECGTPQHISGTRRSAPSCMYEGCSFQFECLPTFWIVDGSSNAGDTTVRCQRTSALWDYGTLRCIGAPNQPTPVCPDPGRPPNGVQLCESYWEGGQAWFGCLNRGYQVDSKAPIECQYDTSKNPVPLAWSGPVPNCVDKEGPTFTNCPTRTITIQIYTSPSFTVPVAIDNSGIVTQFYTDPLNFDPADKVSRSMDVTYHAVDANGNHGQCVVYIRIADNQRPNLTCPKSQKIELPSESTIRTLDMAYESQNSLVVSDNSGQVNVTYNPAVLSVTGADVGSIKYIDVTARDSAGNENSCKLQISVTAKPCQAWALKIERGEVKCTNKGDNNGLLCRIRCVGAVFFENVSLKEIYVSCTNGVPGWDRKLPQCVSRHYPSFIQKYQFDYPTPRTDCAGSFKTKFEEAFRKVMETLSTGDCETPMTLTEASRNWVTMETDTNLVKLSANIQIGEIGEAVEKYRKCAAFVLDEISNAKASTNPIRQLVTDTFCKSDTVRYAGISVSGFRCIGNLELRNRSNEHYCVQCPAGYYGVDQTSCFPCQAGYYQTTRNSNNCQQCPAFSRSQTVAATSRDQCSTHCARGMTSLTGLAPCDSCPINTYAANTTYCMPCPTNRHTLGQGKFTIADCLVPCEPGEYSATGLKPCLKCPLHTYQWRSQQSKCVSCDDSSVTISTGRISDSECQPVAACVPGECQHGGRCEIHNHKHYCVCELGYTGGNCETIINPCDSSPCYNEGTCIPNQLKFTCQCPAYTSGPRCEATLHCTNHNCQGGSRCHSNATGFNCVCPVDTMLTGFLCTDERTPCFPANKCTGSSTCVAQGKVRELCQCEPGFSGPTCDVTQHSCQTNPCLNGGTCQTQPHTYKCSCRPGYSGDVCERRLPACRASTCEMGADCVDAYRTNSILCVCKLGYVKDKGVCVQQDVCLSTLCENGARCVNDGGAFRCNCLRGYEGSLCQHNVDDCVGSPCHNGGVCVDEVVGYRCQCDHPDTTGPVCRDIVDNCDPLPCTPDGMLSCINHLGSFECRCRPGYTGVTCADSIDDCASSPCQHSGHCTDLINDYSCVCSPGWTGKDCTTALTHCTRTTCLHGNCLDVVDHFVCSCNEGYLGETCTQRYDVCVSANHCTGPGSTCVSNSTHPFCRCPIDYTGDSCDVRVEPCKNQECRNGGTCVELHQRVECRCVTGYTGARCEVDINECATTSCPGSAVCVDTVGGYRCICPAGKAGLDCNKDINYNVDLPMLPNHPVTLSWPVAIDHDSALTVAFWMRTDIVGSKGTPLTLLMALTNQTERFRQVLWINQNGAHIELTPGNRRSIGGGDLMDGAWHHVAMFWGSSSGDVILYVDRKVVGQIRGYARGAHLSPFLFLGLGALHNDVTGSVASDTRFSGLLNRVLVITSPEPLSFSLEMLAGKSTVNSHVYDQLFVNSDTVKLYDSELTSDTQCPCPTVKNTNQISPSITNCSANQMAVSDKRISRQSWNEPKFSDVTETSVQPNTALAMSWGTHYYTYVGSDERGRAAVCTIRFVLRRFDCGQPVIGSKEGRQSCTNSVCTVDCSGFLLTNSPPTANLYSCNRHKMWTGEEQMMPFKYPGCAAIHSAKVNATLQAKIATHDKCSEVKNSYETEARDQFTTLNNAWSQGLCRSTNCNSLSVELVCNQEYGGTLTVNFPELKDYLVATKSPHGHRSPTDILNEFVFDNQRLSTTNPRASVVLSTLNVGLTTSCDPGSELVNNAQCVDCGVGYHDAGSHRCVPCALGSYQPLTGAVSCIQCPSQMTTATAGAHEAQDCKESCPVGMMYSGSTGDCQSCSIGFYQDKVGQFFCVPCAVDTTTANVGASSASDCKETFPGPGTPSTGESLGASTGGQSSISTGVIIAIVIIFFILAAIVFLILGCCCRDRLYTCCPCTQSSKVGPEKIQDWRYINRFGESNEKHLVYKLSELHKKPDPILPSLTFEADTEALVKPELSETHDLTAQSAALPAVVPAPVKHPKKHRTEEERRERRRQRQERKERRRIKMESTDKTENIVEMNDDADLRPASPHMTVHTDLRPASPRMTIHTDRTPKPLPVVPLPVTENSDVENTTSFAYWRRSLKGRQPNLSPRVTVEVATISNGHLPHYHVETPSRSERKMYVESDNDDNR